jgi:hydrogenase nickel incorporation protein HypB
VHAAPVGDGNGPPSERRAHGTHAPRGGGFGGGGRRGADSVTLEQAVLAKNDQIARRNRAWLQRRDVLALNVVSSPGAGKTTLLERTLTDLNGVPTISVIEGDQETQRDAERVRATGCLAVQINTGAGCHLDAEMVAAGMESLAPPDGSIVVIENVGNLVCPALFDLGEHARIVVLSVTEGDDKPLKYPTMFRSAHLLLLNKIDLLPYVNFSVERAIGYARRINPSVEVLQVSATTGEGMETWYEWLRQRVSEAAA